MVLTKDTLELTFKVTGLKEKQEYTYRVIAENKAGPGEPSKETTVTAKYDFGRSNQVESIL